MEDLIDLDGGLTGNDDVVSNIRIVHAAPTGLLSWLVKVRVVKNARVAEMALLGVVITLVILTIVVLVLNFYHPQNSGSSGRLGAPVQTVKTHQ